MESCFENFYGQRRVFFFGLGGVGGEVVGGERGALWIGLNVPSVCGDHCSNSEC